MRVAIAIHKEEIMKKHRMEMLATALLVLALAPPDGLQAQQPYPSKPIQIISMFSPGQQPDTQSRRVAAKLSELLGQPVVVENRPASGGVMAAQAVARASPDGYTLSTANAGTLILKHLNPAVAYDPVADFAPVIPLTDGPLALMVRADMPYGRTEDLIAQAKARPGKFSYGSGGVGATSHLGSAVFVSLAGIEATHVPYKGMADVLPGLYRGDVDFAYLVTSTAVTQAKSGKLRVLNVTSRSRLKYFPDTPTLHEITGNELAVLDNWSGVWAPAKTPIDVQRKLHAAGARAVADPEVRKVYEATGGDAAPPLAGPEEYAEFVRRENDKWRQIVKLSGAKAN
jgi:tripartite-type tricarboxylate transporter receptor subunit TctC